MQALQQLPPPVQLEMHRRREKRREQRDAKVSATLDRLDATPSLAQPHPAWEVAPQPDNTGSSSVDWAALPALNPAADALLKPDRAQRKREQLQSLLQLLHSHVLPILPPTSPGRPRRFVDFACGSGHFGLLVASQVPESEVTLVDMQEHGLAKARDRAASLGLSDRVTVWCGGVADYEGEFDCALGLHSCGSEI